MKQTLQALAALVAGGAIAIWLATGAHRGWTKTSVPRMTWDEVTGIESPIYEKKFVVGVDLLGAALLGAVALAGLSFFFAHKQSKQTET